MVSEHGYLFEARAEARTGPLPERRHSVPQRGRGLVQVPQGRVLLEVLGVAGGTQRPGQLHGERGADGDSGRIDGRGIFQRNGHSYMTISKY